ncbi:binding-protein-dependent transport system inner membrane protein [Mycobacterium tuberculosis]|nr:binding-protein-dependent transport system inner membrane protein [Mycobacterium tuberculosis]
MKLGNTRTASGVATDDRDDGDRETREPAHRPAARTAPRRQVPGFVLSWGLFLILLGLWQLIVRAFDVSIVLVPAPSDVIRSLLDGLESGFLLEHMWVTMKEILIGFGLAIGMALASAALITQFRIMDKALLPILVLIQTIPKVAMAPLLLMWFGIGMTSKVLTIALIAYFPLLVNTILGLRSAEPEQIDMLRSFGASEFQIMRRLRLPSALPHIFAGLDVAVILSVTGAVVAEFVGATAGLGYTIQATNFNMDVARTFAVVVLLSIIGMTLHAVVVTANRWLVFWAPSGKEHARDL